jgi:hypothetical protein
VAASHKALFLWKSQAGMGIARYVGMLLNKRVRFTLVRWAVGSLLVLVALGGCDQGEPGDASLGTVLDVAGTGGSTSSQDVGVLTDVG